MKKHRAKTRGAYEQCAKIAEKLFRSARTQTHRSSLSHALKSTPAQRPWTEPKAQSLARTPGTHKNPGEPGFALRVSPKLKAVYAYKFRDGKGAEKSGTLGEAQSPTVPNGLTLEAALLAFQKIKEDARAAPGAQLSLGEGFEKWISSHRKRNGEVLAPATLDYYRKAYERYLAGSADVQLRSATPEYWLEVLKRAQERSKDQTRGAYWVLSLTYKHCIEMKLLTENPLENTVLQRQFAGSAASAVRTRALSLVDAPEFIGNVMRLPEASRDAVLLLYLTGWRHAAVLRMRWEAIDFDNGAYLVEAGLHGWKRFKGAVALSDYALSTLRERKKGPAGDTEWVFPARHGKSEHMVDVGGGVESASAGLTEQLSPHDLRRTWATAANTVLHGDLRLIGRLIGHATVKSGGGDDVWNPVTAQYVITNLESDRASAQHMAETLLEVGGVLPLSTETRDLFAKKRVAISPELAVF